RKPIDLSKIFKDSHNPRAGAIVLFSGEVRNHHQGKDVGFLEYEAYESMANKMIDRVLNEAKEKWELNLVYCIHRLGKLEISETAVVVLTAAPHRKEAFEANKWIIDKIKHEVPIWKKETFIDGTSDWVVQCEGCTFASEIQHKNTHAEPTLPPRYSAHPAFLIHGDQQ
ncbi:MAG TPA: molybdenum cofactor biosynthesis protein MoaE, partial [Leptospiraceae bacterium]|nr:molybdenum cofactor biosynthesis protein MoaE [Leptospiraceae bacterium]